jgi:glycosyltransferase involved in cell wall biosynthesis
VKVLAIDEALPFPTDSGKRIRTVELLIRAARESELLLLVPEESPPAAEHLAVMKAAGVDVVRVARRPLVKRGPRFAWDLLRNVFLPVPYMVMAHRLRAVRDRVAALVAERKPDLIHVEWTPLVANVPAGLGIPVVISAHNVESDIWARYRDAERSWFRRSYIALQLRKVRRFERRALAEADAVIAVSEGDAKTIREWTGQPHVTVVPNGVDAERFAPVPGPAEGSKELLFLGSLDWRPNQDGVVWFLEHVWDRVLRAMPEATFCVVGRSPPEWLVTKCRAARNTTVEASVPDVRPFIARTAALVVPLRVGGGSRLKICEALAMGRPVVSTTVGAEGLELDGGAVIADEPDAFAKAACEAISDPDAATSRAARGRASVLRHHEWGTAAPILVAAWRQAVERGPKAAR